MRKVRDNETLGVACGALEAHAHTTLACEIAVQLRDVVDLEHRRVVQSLDQAKTRGLGAVLVKDEAIGGVGALRDG